LVGVSLLLGGLRYHEQEYNLKGVTAYLSVIMSLAMFGVIMPDFTSTTPGPTFSRAQEVFLIVMCVGLYAVFLAIQTTRHRSFFLDRIEAEAGASAAPDVPPEAHEPRVVWRHVALLAIYLGLVIYLVEKLAILLDHGLDELGAP